MVGSLVATVVALMLVQRVAKTYDDGLIATRQSAELIAEAVEPLAALASDVGELAGELVGSLEVANEVLGISRDVLTEVGGAASTNLAELATGAAGISDDLAGLVDAIERLIPGDSDSLAEDLRRLADGLGPLSDQLTVLGDRLTAASAELEAAEASLTALADRMEAVVDSIEALGPSFDALETAASDVLERAEDAAARLSFERWLLRILIVMAGATVAMLGRLAERFAVRLAEPSTAV